ncbi:hypothetical protein EDB89DRAFT_1910510 [Lactarius sanguifluus]|nr:hypothetical protein EDB89DRAFT_1910510 [Lactarius sanguifluus]
MTLEWVGLCPWWPWDGFTPAYCDKTTASGTPQQRMFGNGASMPHLPVPLRFQKAMVSPTQRFFRRWEIVEVLVWTGHPHQQLKTTLGWTWPYLPRLESTSESLRQHTLRRWKLGTVLVWTHLPSPMARDDFGMDSPISPRVHAQGTVPTPSQQDGLPDEGIGADLALPTEAGEHVRIPSVACTEEVETQDNFGMDAPPSPMAQDDFGMVSPVSPRDGLLDEGIGADLALPTKAREHHIRTPSAACTINWGGHALSPVDSEIQEGQVGESSEALQEVQVQHPAELVLQEEFSASTRAAILRAKGARLRRICAQVWYVYEQEKEMSEVIDKMIEELDNAEAQNLM